MAESKMDLPESKVSTCYIKYYNISSVDWEVKDIFSNPKRYLVIPREISVP